MQGQEHAPFPEAEMPGNVVSDAKGKAGEQSPLLVAAGGRMDQWLHPLFKTYMQTFIPPPMSFSFCSSFQIWPFCEAAYWIPGGALLWCPTAVAPKGGFWDPD